MNATPADAGRYSVIVRNADDEVLSASATLAISAPPNITSLPKNLTVAAGGTASFQVVAESGLPLTYQWRRDGDDIAGAVDSISR